MPIDAGPAGAAPRTIAADTPSEPPAWAAEGEGFASFTSIATELGKRQAQLAAPHPEEDWSRQWDQLRDLQEVLARQRPEHPREALVTAAVAAGLLRDLREAGEYEHALVMRLVAQLVDYLEASAGVSAEALGVGSFAEGRHDGPKFGEDDGREILQVVSDAGYLAAVRRFAPTFYPFVQRELDRAHGFNPLTAAAIGEARS
jgi:hypothetical protein